MKKYLKKVSKLLMLVMAMIMMIPMVNAETAPSKLTMTYYTQSSLPMSFPANFHVKKTTGGKYAYCTYYSKNPPVKSVGYARSNKVSDAGMNYILEKSYSAKNDNEFFIYQTALWSYMIDKGLMKGAYYDLTVFKSKVSSSSSSTATKIKNLVSNAKKATTVDTSAPTIKVDTSNAKFTYDSSNDTYVSSGIIVTSSTGSYEVDSFEVPDGSGASANIKGNELIIVIPKKNITTLATTVTFTVSNSKDVYTSYYYKPSNSSYQIMTTTYKDTKKESAKGSLKLNETTSIEVIKTDESGTALSGATMQITNASGKAVDSWTTDGNKHTVSGLSAGTYTLKETAAPAGYILSTEQIKFTVGSDGKVKDSNGDIVTLITFKNQKTSVTISKQDITNSSELPGAKLVIKDQDGKEIISWTSSSKPYIIKGLSAGTYTLTETQQPAGYILSEETITFKIDSDGKLYDKDGKNIAQVVMYNTKENTPGGVSISKQDITNGKELPGATLIVKDYDGNKIEQWVSTTEPHLIENLKPGIYTLTEIQQPAGYILSTETITFTVKEDGTITKVVMYNSPNSKDVPTTPTTPNNVPVENTASFKTITSSVIGAIIAMIGAVVIFKNVKRKDQN